MAEPTTDKVFVVTVHMAGDLDETFRVRGDYLDYDSDGITIRDSKGAMVAAFPAGTIVYRADVLVTAEGASLGK